MFFYYIKIALKNLWNNKKYSAINIVGFSFSLSIFLVIILFILHEKSFDRYHQNSETIYRLTDEKDNSSSIDYRVKDVLVEQFAEINNVCLYQQVSHDIPVTYAKTGYYITNISSVDKAFFEMFDVDFIKGNKNRPFENLNSVILTESNAQMIFGNGDPIGKELNLMSNFPLVVSAIIKDFPNTSSFEAGMIVNAKNDDFRFSSHIGNSDDLSTYRWPFRIYIQSNEHKNTGSLLTSINNNLDLLKPYVNKAGLIPLVDIYLHDNTYGSRTKKGNPALIRLLLAVALVILLMAIINYINLTIAQQQKRGKEIGVRKTIGATKVDLITQFLFESISVTVTAFGISLILVELMSPFFQGIFNVPLSLSVLFLFPLNIIMGISVLSIGLLTGIWPALLFSRFNPIGILSKRTVIRGHKNYSRNALTVFQFTVSIALVFCVIVIQKQIEFSKHKDLGFNKDQLLRIDLPQIAESNMNSATGMINELRNLAYVTDLTLSSGVPGNINFHMGAGIEGKDKTLAILRVDSTFLRTFDIKILEGRDFLSGDAGKACMINQAAMDYFEWENIENKIYNNGRKGGYKVVGVLDDFHISSTHNVIEPLAVLLDLRQPIHLSLKISGDHIGATMAYIQKSWKKALPEYPLEYQFYDDWFASMYEKEERFGRIISFFAILAISISCIGILGLAIFTSERRTKEIGIRKVNGASIENIVFLLTREFTTWVLIAFIIAAPLAYFAINTWLEDFAYRTEISWWVFAVSGLSALFIAWGTVGWQSLKAAMTNPVEALRYE